MEDDSSEESQSSIDNVSNPAQSCTLPPETEAALKTLEKYCNDRERQLDSEDEIDTEHLQARRLDTNTPMTPVVERTSSRKPNVELGTSGAKRLDDIQKSIFTPTKKARNSRIQVNDMSRNHEVEQPKILSLKVNEAVRMEVLRSKRNFIAGGPPLLKDKPTLEEFNDWQVAIVKFLEFLPGYEEGMLEISPNLGEMSDEDYNFTIERYELIHQTLIKATSSNKLVKLKTCGISRYPIFDIVTWWNTLGEIFQPSDAQIKALKNEYNACEQKQNQTGTEYLLLVEEKALELSKLGKIYDNQQIGKRVYEGLLPTVKQFAYTTLMSQRITCDLQAMTKILKTYDDMNLKNLPEIYSTESLKANAVNMSFTNNNQRSRKRKEISSSEFTDNDNSGKSASGIVEKSRVPIDKLFLGTKDMSRAKGNPKTILTGRSQVDLNDNNFTDEDAEIVKNQDVEYVVKNLRRFKRLIKVIKANKDKESKDNSTYNSNEPMDRGNSISRTWDNYEQVYDNSPSTHAKSNQNYHKEFYMPKYSSNNTSESNDRSPKGGNPSQNFFRENKRYRDDSRDKGQAPRSRYVSRSNHDGNSSNYNNDTRYYYFIILNSNCNCQFLKLGKSAKSNIVECIEAL